MKEKLFYVRMVSLLMQLELESNRNPGNDLEPSAWIAARYDAESFPDEMVLGDGLRPGSGDYFNRPLPDYLPYRVFVHAVTETNVSAMTGHARLLSSFCRRTLKSHDRFSVFDQKQETVNVKDQPQCKTFGTLY